MRKTNVASVLAPSCPPPQMIQMKRLFTRDEPDQPPVQQRTSRRSTANTMKKLFGLEKPDPPLPISMPISQQKRTPTHQQVSPNEKCEETTPVLPPVTTPVDIWPQSDVVQQQNGTDPTLETFKYKVKALYPYTADDPTEISLNQGEILHIGDRPEADWWQVRKANGTVGLAPSNYLQLL
ncbi:Osmosensor protein [Mycena venus]|uniref:Osmosensor protein n=1 Tax=Mycena venus TaxID=2733690 RepID=A0A8H6U1W6_9AGAR|nr:Osmosensor protein [Mycena venus]